MKAYKLYYDNDEENKEKYFSTSEKALNYAKTEGLEHLLNDIKTEDWEEPVLSLDMEYQQDAEDIDIQYYLPNRINIYPYETAHILCIEIN